MIKGLLEKIRPSNAQLSEEGFTMVEIVFVILIIGILAAIGTPLYLDQIRTAEVGTVTSDLTQTASTLEANQVGDGLLYNPCTADFAGSQVLTHEDTTMNCRSYQMNSYEEAEWCIEAQNMTLDVIINYSSRTTEVSEGGCIASSREAEPESIG